MNKQTPKILFLAKNKPFADDAAQLLQLHVKDAEIIFGNSNEPFPAHVLEKNYDYVISYISPWIIPQSVLSGTRQGAINFHTGSPDYPGIGCTNFAIYNNECEFGITVHHMEEKVDCGAIIAVEQFSIFPNDTVYSLTQRCYAYIYTAFTKVFPLILNNLPLPESGQQWQRKPYKRKELNDLCCLTKDMTQEEIQKRIKAATYPNMPGAYWKEDGCPAGVNAQND